MYGLILKEIGTTTLWETLHNNEMKMKILIVGLFPETWNFFFSGGISHFINLLVITSAIIKLNSPTLVQQQILLGHLWWKLQINIPQHNKSWIFKFCWYWKFGTPYWYILAHEYCNFDDLAMKFCEQTYNILYFSCEKNLFEQAGQSLHHFGHSLECF